MQGLSTSLFTDPGLVPGLGFWKRRGRADFFCHFAEVCLFPIKEALAMEAPISFFVSMLVSGSLAFLLIYLSAAGTSSSCIQLPLSLASCCSTLLANLAS